MDLMGDAWQTDPILKTTLDVDAIPAAFLALPDDEQMWRGRLFLAVYWMSHSMAYSWSAALTNTEPYLSDWRAIILDAPDELLVTRFRAAQAEIAVETGAGIGPTQ
jgi:hypothetical protein